jgi:hypothetical protein
MTILSFVEFLQDGWVSIIMGNQCIQQKYHVIMTGVKGLKRNETFSFNERPVVSVYVFIAFTKKEFVVFSTKDSA